MECLEAAVLAFANRKKPMVAPRTRTAANLCMGDAMRILDVDPATWDLENVGWVLRIF